MAVYLGHGHLLPWPHTNFARHIEMGGREKPHALVVIQCSFREHDHIPVAGQNMAERLTLLEPGTDELVYPAQLLRGNINPSAAF